MEDKTVARIGAVVFVVGAIVAAAFEMNRKDESSDTVATQRRPVAARDPLNAELQRCSQIGEAGARDPACLKAWAENRRRFLRQPAPEASSAPPAPPALFPTEAGPSDSASPTEQTGPAQPEVR